MNEQEQSEARTKDDSEIRFRGEDALDLARRFLEFGQRAYRVRRQWMDEQVSNIDLLIGRLAERDFPWPGAPNLALPVAQRFVRMQEAQYSEVIGVAPLTHIDPVDHTMDFETARVWEKYLESKIDGVMEGRKTLRDAVRQMLIRKGTFVKVTYRKEWEWRDAVIDLEAMSPFEAAGYYAASDDALREVFTVDYEMDPEDEEDKASMDEAIRQIRKGETQITVKRRVKVADTPVWTVVPTEHLLRDMTGPSDIQKHRVVVHRFWQPLGDVRGKERDKIYEKGTYEAVKDSPTEYSSGSEYDNLFDMAALQSAGISDFGRQRDGEYVENDDRFIETWEVYAWHSPSKGAREKRAVFTLFPGAKQGSGFARAYWLNRELWPFKEFEYENYEGRTSSALSSIDILRDIQVYMNTLVNMNLEALLVGYLPFGVYDPDALDVQTSGALQVSPGTFLPGRVGRSVETLKMQTNQRENMVMSQEILGHAELVLGQQQNVLSRPGGASQDPRTKYEIQTVNALSNRVGSLDIERFQTSVSGLLWLTVVEIVENMEEEDRFLAFGQDGAVEDAVRRRDIEGLRMRIRAHGTLAHANKQLEIAKWVSVLQDAIQFAQLGVPVDFRQLAVYSASAKGVQDVSRIYPAQQQQGVAGGPMVPQMGGSPQGAQSGMQLMGQAVPGIALGA